jgi:hypothetical protein
VSRNAYKVLTLSLLSAILLAYTNCGKKSDLQFTSGASATEIEAFERTVYQITRNQSCVGCHTSQSPMHAADDLNTAFEAATSKINWSNPGSSRLVLKLKDENHNCWSDCASDAEEMLDAILAMRDMIEASGTSTNPRPAGTGSFIATSQSRVIQTELDDTANPQKSNTVRPNVEAAMVQAPMSIVDDPLKGKILTVPETKNTTLTATDPTAGVAFLNFDVRVQANYRVWMYVNAPNTNDNGFFVRFNNTPAATTFDPTVNGSDYGWMLVPNLSQNLAIGRHTLQIREKKDGTKINGIIVTADTTFNGVDVGSYVGVTLTYDLSNILKVPNAKLMIDLADYDPYSYKLLNPRIIAPGANVYVKNMRILINKYFRPQDSAFTTVDKIITAADPNVSAFSTVINKDKGLSLDKLSFEFEKLEVSTGAPITTGGTSGGTTVNPATSLAAYRTSVYPVSRQYCISCHTTQYPEHASANAQIAHDVVIDDPLVNFDSPINSRLYRKVKNNRHNCGSNANCDMIADQFLQGINAWKSSAGY